MSAPGNVLIIDDEDTLRHTLTRVLKTAGCDVSSAADGDTALRMMDNVHFDLVYLDIRLPGMSGLEILQSIRRSYSELPVILFTAHASLQSALEAIRLGATDYLVKPIDPEVFVARTRVILEEQAIEKRKREIQEQLWQMARVPEAKASFTTAMPPVTTKRSIALCRIRATAASCVGSSRIVRQPEGPPASTIAALRSRAVF